MCMGGMGLRAELEEMNARLRTDPEFAARVAKQQRERQEAERAARRGAAGAASDDVNAALGRGDAMEALARAEAACSGNERDVRLKALRGVARVAAGRHAAALKDAEKILEKMPRYSKAVALKAAALNGLGRYEDARRHVAKGLELMSGDEALLSERDAIDAAERSGEDERERGNAAFQRGDHARAVGHYACALAQGVSGDVRAKLHSNRSAALAALGDYTAARDDALSAVSASPAWAKAYGRLGLACLRLGRHAEARSAYEKAVELDPDNAEMRNGLRLASGGPVQKKPELPDGPGNSPGQQRRAPDVAPERARELGNAAFRSERYAEAASLFGVALKHEPGDGKLFSNRSAARAASGDFPGALRDAEEAVRLLPEWAKARSRLGLALFKLGRVADAEAAYRKGLELEPGNSDLAAGLAALRVG